MTDHEAFKDAEPDREPTPDEERAAERAATKVDIDDVASEYEHMTKLGANIRGEGQIESPSARPPDPCEP